ncbi:MAG TPA: hypothetical protein VGQ30_06815 [Gemmatimonadaceae bacterium]|nr:hypothetical protein [Gemmatimonadaceae bacterium]
MNRSRNLFGCGIAALTMAVSACGSDGNSATAPTTADFQVTGVDSALIAARASGDATVSDVNMINGIATMMSWNDISAPVGGSFSLVASNAPSFSSGPGSNCTLNPVDGRFDCPPVVNDHGVTVTRSLAFFDANGVMMDHFDSTTASMNVQAILAGIVATANGADTVNGTRNLTAIGLLGHNTTRIWSGTGAGTHGAYWSDSAATRTADVSFSSTFSNIVAQLPRSANPWPLSGTITRVVTGTGVVTKNGKTKAITISRTVVITFNGTEFVPMVVGSENFTLDLGTGVATRS